MSLMPLGLLSQGGGAGGGVNALTLISTQLISSSTSSITFSSIPSTFTHLQIRIIGKTSAAGNSSGTLLTFNSDTGSNYAWHRLNGNGSTVSSIGVGTRTEISMFAVPASSTTNYFGGGLVDILDYKNTSKNKTIRSLGGNTNDPQIVMHSGLWVNTSAISSLTITANGDSYIAGSRFSLYGVS